MYGYLASYDSSYYINNTNLKVGVDILLLFVIKIAYNINTDSKHSQIKK